jgi:gliding motility-associatede transport system auxiliary component
MKFISRRAYALIAITLGVVLFVAVNIVSNTWLGAARLDLTSNGLYTVSPGTRATLGKLDEPVTLRFYFSREPASGFASLVAYAGRVRDLLQEYAAFSGGRIILEEIDPAPFTQAEDEAVAQGLTGAPTDQGETVYFGLVGSNTLNGHEVVAFFDQAREQYLEYDLTSIIYKLSTPQRPKLGIMSGLPLEGGLGGFMAAIQGTSQPFTIYTQLRSVYDVQNIEQTADRIPADITTLMVVHPAGFSDAAMYAIDQFVLRGGHAIVFVDPLSEILNQQGPNQVDSGERTTSNLPPLFTAWGIDYDPSKIVGDAELAQQVQVAGPGGPQVTGYLAWMRMTPASFNAGDPVTGNLQQLNIATAGALKHHEGSTTNLTPLLQSSSTAALIDTIQIRVTQRPQDLLRSFEPTGERFNIAARVSGPVKTAFPNGAPPPTPPSVPPGATPPPPEPPATPLPEQVKEASDINVIVVADTDLLDDRFWVNVQNLLGQRIAVPTADNGAMVQNFVENMMGSNDLISLRTRERPTRPFVLVDNIRRQAESQFLAEERALQDRVTQTEASLRALQGQGGSDENPTGTPVLSAEQQKQIDQFRQDLIQSRQSLRQVQANLRRDVENLGTALAVLNIALVPVLVSAAAIGLAVLRNRRRSRARGM